MVLVDTSIWVEHLRKGEPALIELLNKGLALTHPFVIGELACGNLKQRAAIIADLRALPTVAVTTYEEALRLIDDRKLWGRGIGWTDANLLASALAEQCAFWTLDKRLKATCQGLGIEIHDSGTRTQ